VSVELQLTLKKVKIHIRQGLHATALTQTAQFSSQMQIISQ
jgi:hypothetical protein